MYVNRQLTAKLFLAGLMTTGLVLAGCAHDQYKAHKISSNLKYAEPITGNEELGVKNGDLVVQKKVLMSEQLRDLQNKVYALQDRVYGDEDYHSEGIYGALVKCRAALVSPAYGGNGHLMWTEPMDRVVHSSKDFIVGLDNRNQIIGIKTEYLKNRIARFRQDYAILKHREHELTTQLDVCDTALNAAKWKMKHKSETAQN